MTERYTQEVYVDKLKEKNPDIIVCDNYINSQTPIKHFCKKHNEYFYKKPVYVLQGKGCSKCTVEHKREAYAKKQEAYVSELSEKAPHIKVIGTYVNAFTHITHYCTKHNHYWEACPHEVLQKLRCPICGMELYQRKRRKTHEAYVKEVALKNPSIEVVGKYVNSKTKITHYCKVHNCFWDTTPNSILNGCGCPMCRLDKFKKTRTKTHEEYLQLLNEVNPEIIPLENYVTATTKILHYCKRHDLKWETTPYNVLNLACGCPECLKEKISEKNRKSHEQYLLDLKDKKIDVMVVDEYINSSTPIKHKCVKCGYEWYSNPTCVLNSKGCPHCAMSKGEKSIKDWLIDNNIEYYSQYKYEDCKDRRPLPFDFYLPKYNLCIEYQGKQHYEEIEYFGGKDAFTVRQEHDEIKRKYCKENGVELLEIPYYANVSDTLNNFLFT